MPPPNKAKIFKKAAAGSGDTGDRRKAAEEDAAEDDEPIVWSGEEKQELQLGSTIGGAYTALVVAIYLKTMHPTLAGGDSGELMGCACELGVAHPPGYPLFTMLSWLGTKILPFGSPGYRLNLVSVIFAAAGAYFHYHAMLRLHLQYSRHFRSSDGNKSWVGSAWVSLLASSLVNFGPLVWMYSTHAEVFAMNNLFVSLLMYLVVRYLQEREINLARLGALVIGLGLTNQHTLILYAVPLAGWIMYSGRKQLCNTHVFIQLCICGVVGLSPYLYLFWAATHAPLGSWGDTSTLSGWPATGFWTHFLRKEYGTFSLYSGSNGKNMLVEAMTLWMKHAFKDTFGLVIISFVGMLSAATRKHVRSVGLLFAVLFTFYMVFFHSLSNLPLDQPLFLGVHVRFWMQPNLVLFCFVPIGLHEFLAAGKLWRPQVVIPFVVLTASALVGVNFEAMDQSSNYYVIEFGRALLESRKQGSIILTQGDMVTNSIRYLQRCEKVRLDVAHMDMPMMTYEWYKTMHGPHLPGGPVIPGAQFSVGGKLIDAHRLCKGKKLPHQCPYSMKQFLDANFKKNASRPIYLVGGWYGSELPTNTNPKGGIPGYKTEHVGMVARIVSEQKPLSWKEYREEFKNFDYNLDFVPPATYNTMTWEHNIRTNYITYMQATYVEYMDKAIARGKEPVEGTVWIKEQKALKAAIDGLELTLQLARQTPGFEESLEDILRNLGIAYGRLKCAEPNLYPKVDCPGQTKMRVLFKEFLRITKKGKQEVANEQLVVDNPNAFINLAG